MSARHIEDFLTLPQYAGALADATRKSYADRLRIFFAWCKEEGTTPHNPVPEPEKRGKAARAQRKEGPPPFFTEEAFAALLRVIEADAEAKGLRHGNRWLLDIVRFAAGTGLRRGEVVHLRWCAVDPFAADDYGLVRVMNTEEFTTKSGRERTVPLVGDALGVVRRLHAERGPDPLQPGDGYVFRGATGGKLGIGYVSKRFREYRRLARLPEALHLHSLRHTFASWFVQRKGDLYHLKEIMGHADMKTTLQYAHLRPDALRSEMLLTFGAGLMGTPRGTPGAHQNVERPKEALGTATDLA